MNWIELLQILKDCLPAGTVTTYGNLSEYVFGHPGAANAIIAMLNAAVNADYENRVWTNRVVNQQGGIVNKNGALEQLESEVPPLLTNERVDLNRYLPVIIGDCINDVGVPDIDKHIIAQWENMQFPEVSNDQSFTWTGFDSAWTGKKPGAMAWMTGTRNGLIFDRSIPATFEECTTHALLKAGILGRDMHLLMIDQPTIVPNQAGKRPVEIAISHELGRARSAVQPANRNKQNMFGDNAPIWSFLEELKKDRYIESTGASVKAKKGLFYLETYPALGNLGLFGYQQCPKYNPDRRKTFSIDDWKMLCGDIGLLGVTLKIKGLHEWAEKMKNKNNPTAHPDQDCLDAVLCMLFGYVWWRSGLKHSTLIGNNKTGYMVIPCLRANLRSQLKNDADQHGVPVDTPFQGKSIPTDEEQHNHDDSNQEESKSQENTEKHEANSQKGFVSRLLGIFRQG